MPPESTPSAASAVSPLLLSLARRYARRQFRRRFEGLYVDGLEATKAASAAGPILFVANHLSWWDVPMMVAVDAALHTRGRALMDERNLRRLPFFGAIGAVPLSLTDPRRALQQLKDGQQHLQRPGDAVWIFPQGAQRPSWQIPLGFQRGYTRLLPSDASSSSNAPVAIVPVSVVMTWGERPEPAIMVRLHPAIAVDRVPVGAAAQALTTSVEAKVTEGIVALRAMADDGRRPPTLVAGTAQQRDDGFPQRLLGRLFPWREAPTSPTSSPSSPTSPISPISPTSLATAKKGGAAEPSAALVLHGVEEAT